jgi:hypothetical protein
MTSSLWPWLKQLFTLLEIPELDAPRLLNRIETMERNILLPVRAVHRGIHFLLVRLNPVVWAGVEHGGRGG